jgi:hypothetical protein
MHSVVFYTYTIQLSMFTLQSALYVHPYISKLLNLILCKLFRICLTSYCNLLVMESSLQHNVGNLPWKSADYPLEQHAEVVQATFPCLL